MSQIGTLWFVRFQFYFLPLFRTGDGAKNIKKHFGIFAEGLAEGSIGTDGMKIWRDFT